MYVKITCQRILKVIDCTCYVQYITTCWNIVQYSGRIFVVNRKSCHAPAVSQMDVVKMLLNVCEQGHRDLHVYITSYRWDCNTMSTDATCAMPTVDIGLNQSARSISHKRASSWNWSVLWHCAFVADLLDIQSLLELDLIAPVRWVLSIYLSMYGVET